MPSSAYQRPVVSNPTTDFIEGLATGVGSAIYSLALPDKSPFWFIKGFTLVATENLQYEIQLFSKAAGGTGVLATENFIGAWQFSALSAGPPAFPGYPITGDGLFLFYIDGNMIPYIDQDLNTGGASGANAQLHVRLVNRSAASKTAGADGALILTAWCAPQGMQA